MGTDLTEIIETADKYPSAVARIIRARQEVAAAMEDANLEEAELAEKIWNIHSGDQLKVSGRAQFGRKTDGFIPYWSDSEDFPEQVVTVDEVGYSTGEILSPNSAEFTMGVDIIATTADGQQICGDLKEAGHRKGNLVWEQVEPEAVNPTD